MPTYRHVWQGLVLTLLMSVLALGPLSAQTPIEPIVRSVLDELLSDDPDKRMIAIERIALTSHPQAAATLLALDEERLFACHQASGFFSRLTIAGKSPSRPNQ